MPETKSTKETFLVSFVVPTLNRGRYVLRAVASCLRNASDSVDVEVVVIDSSSEDGSFETLQAKYGGDRRVRLLQNARGSGPLKSWIEGVEAATGKYMTFVWSDDLISPLFLRMLLPPLQAGAVVSYGAGKIVSVDTNLEFSEVVPEPEFIDGHRFLAQYYEITSHESVPIAASPVCSLFDAEVVREWAHHVREFCRATRLREHLMWRRAIGPDLMLYLWALAPGTPQVALFRTTTAQFSAHPGSITISSDKWDLRAGYWLAKLSFIDTFQQNEHRDSLRKYWEWAFITGCYLLLGARLSTHRRHVFGILKELASLVFIAWRRGFLASGFRNAMAASLDWVGKRLVGRFAVLFVLKKLVTDPWWVWRKTLIRLGVRSRDAD